MKLKDKLVRGVDYVIENGNFVFTEKYLLERGYCCNKKCRNCPYKKDKKQWIFSY